MIITSSPHLLARRAAYVHFAIAFFPTLAVLSYFVSPALAIAVLSAGTIAFCVSVLVTTVFLFAAFIRRQDKKYMASTIGWGAAAQGAFTVQAVIIYALIQRI